MQLLAHVTWGRMLARVTRRFFWYLYPGLNATATIRPKDSKVTRRFWHGSNSAIYCKVSHLSGLAKSVCRYFGSYLDDPRGALRCAISCCETLISQNSEEQRSVLRWYFRLGRHFCQHTLALHCESLLSVSRILATTHCKNLLLVAVQLWGRRSTVSDSTQSGDFKQLTNSLRKSLFVR